MDKPERSEQNESQKAKLIFFSLAALVIILLIWSFYTANSARQERDRARLETEQARQDISKLELMLKDQTLGNDELKKKLQLCETRLAVKPAAKKPVAAKAKKAPKKPSKSTRSR